MNAGMEEMLEGEGPADGGVLPASEVRSGDEPAARDIGGAAAPIQADSDWPQLSGFELDVCLVAGDHLTRRRHR